MDSFFRLVSPPGRSQPASATTIRASIMGLLSSRLQRNSTGTTRKKVQKFSAVNSNVVDEMSPELLQRMKHFDEVKKSVRTIQETGFPDSAMHRRAELNHDRHQSPTIAGRLSPNQTVKLLQSREFKSKEALRDQFELPNTYLIENMWRYYGVIGMYQEQGPEKNGSSNNDWTASANTS